MIHTANEERATRGDMIQQEDSEAVTEDSASIILTGVGRSLHQWITSKWQRLTSAKVVTKRSESQRQS